MHTLRHEFVDIVDEFESEDDIVADDEVNAHAVERAFFDGELAHLLGIMISEFELDVAIWSSLSDQLNAHDLHLCRLVLFQLFFLDVSEQCMFVLLE